ncbi:MAG: trypsin-like peptidase domain-containing protein [Acidimicrobiia bacterium]|nr:trypsin-like peptidase domain-containing protein [Acidimicrobiia bacterium]
MNEHTARPPDSPDPLEPDDEQPTGEIPSVFDSSPYDPTFESPNGPGPVGDYEDRSRYEDISTSIFEDELIPGTSTAESSDFTEATSDNVGTQAGTKDGNVSGRTGVSPISPPAHPALPPSPPVAVPLDNHQHLHPPQAANDPLLDDRIDRERTAMDGSAPVPLAQTAAAWERTMPPRQRRSGLFLALVGGLVGAGLTVGALYAGGVFEPRTQLVETVRTEIATPTQVDSTTAAAIAGKVTPAIVTVRLPNGSGSGVIYDAENGYIITNEHVVESAVTVEIVLADGRSYTGQVLGSDSLTDLAVIDIDANGLTQVEVGETETLVVGDPAYAIGNPLALVGTPTVTEGIVSAFDRRVEGATEAETLYGMLQTDAPFTRGSSGGSLVDREGRLIGITTAVAVSDIGAEGLGFATPVEIVQRVVDELINAGVSTHGFLGINGGTKFRETSDQGQRPIGVEVVEILSPSAAGDAGMSAGDVITHVDGHPIDTMQELISRLRHYSARDLVNIDYLENGEIVSSIEIELGDRS